MADGGVRERASEALTRAKRRVGIENPSAADADGNVGTVRGALRALGDGELDQFVDALKSDVTWEAPGGNFPGEESLDGPDEVKERFLGDVGRTFTEFGFRPEKFVDAEGENAVVVLGTFVGEGVQGGSLSEPSVLVFQFEGTEVQHVRVYTDSAAFPEVVTEERQRELEEEEKEEQQDEDEDGEGKAESDDSQSGDEESGGESESKSESEAKSESKSESESESGSESEAKSESESESGSSDQGGEGESRDE